MARKKNRKSAADTNKLNNPFGSLKGFAVSAEDPSCSVPSQKPAAESVPATDEIDFDAQMARYGVQRLNAEESATDHDAADLPATGEPDLEDCDEKVFLTAMKGLNVPFTDVFTTDDVLSAPAPRRMKQLRRGTLVPDATLDLHGFARQDVEAKLLSFITNARHQGWQVLLVITGKGLHSPDGEGVLRSAVEDFLQRSGNDPVVEWGRAPRQYGGDGAIVLFLRRQQG